MAARSPAQFQYRRGPPVQELLLFLLKSFSHHLRQFHPYQKQSSESYIILLCEPNCKENGTILRIKLQISIFSYQIEKKDFDILSKVCQNPSSFGIKSSYFFSITALMINPALSHAFPNILN